MTLGQSIWVGPKVWSGTVVPGFALESSVWTSNGFDSDCDAWAFCWLGMILVHYWLWTRAILKEAFPACRATVRCAVTIAPLYRVPHVNPSALWPMLCTLSKAGWSLCYPQFSGCTKGSACMHIASSHHLHLNGELALQTWVLHKPPASGKCSFWHFSCDSYKLVKIYQFQYHVSWRLQALGFINSFLPLHSSVVTVCISMEWKTTVTSPTVYLPSLSTWSSTFYIPQRRSVGRTESRHTC